MNEAVGRRTFIAAVGALASVAGAFVRAAPGPRVIRIVAMKFDFVPDEIRVAPGETVILELSAPDVAMGINLPDFNLRADIVPGRASTLQFTPGKPGSYAFVCDEFCGSGHEDMSGTIIVG